MNAGLIPRRYAKALYAAAVENGQDAAVYDRMLQLEQGFAAQPGMQSVMANPFVSDSDKISLLSVSAGIGRSAGILADYFKLLAQNGRLDMARASAMAYVNIYRRAHNIFKVSVRTAAPLAAVEEERLRALIERHLDGGILEYDTVVDPSLIGGFTVSVGNELLDASVSKELKQLRLNLLSK